MFKRGDVISGYVTFGCNRKFAFQKAIVEDDIPPHGCVAKIEICHADDGIQGTSLLLINKNCKLVKQ